MFFPPRNVVNKVKEQYPAGSEGSERERIDYIVILEDKSDKRVILITGYPVFFISAKRDYESDYQNYLKNLEK